MTNLPPELLIRSATTDIDSTIRAEQVRQLYRALGKSLFSSILTSILLIAILWPTANHSYLLFWLALLSTTSLYQFRVLRQFKRTDLTSDNTHWWETQFLTGCALAAFAWGASAFLLFPADDMTRQVFLAFVIGGMSAGAISSLSYQKYPVYVFQTITLTPLAIRFLANQSELGFVMGGMIILYLVMLLLASRNSYENFLQNIRLRFQQNEQKDLAQQSEQKYRTLFELSDDAIMILDKDGLIDGNPASLKIFGYNSKEEFLGKHPVEISPPYQPDGTDSLAAANERIETAFREGRNFFEWTHRRRNGEEFAAEILLTPMQLEGRSLLQAIVRDISARKQAEVNIVQALEHAKKANQAKTEFLSSMSHELRTPLNPILGFAQILELEAKEKTEKQNIIEIITAGKHLLSLIGDILDLSKIEAGKIQIVTTTLRLNDILQECLAFVEPQIKKRGIAVYDEITPHSDYYIEADQTRFKQVVLNLLSNAIKYNVNNGDIYLRSSLSTKDSFLQISVIDTGYGINEEQKRTLFEPFMRGTTSDAIEGTGIGLVITRRLIELMNGSILVKSKVGEGSEFIITIPLCKTRKVTAAPEVSIPANNARSDVQSKSKLVIYIEDNPTNTNLVKQVVEDLTPYRFVSAENAYKGLEIIANEKPDLVLMDINLPGMNGYEARENLASSPETRDIPVVAVSANAMANDIEKARKAGFADYITKPVDIILLRDTLTKMLG